MNKKSIITALLALVAMAGRAQNTVSTLADTYWRNEKTGDWLIGITANHVIYDNMVWDIVARTEKKDTYTLTISRPTSDRLQSKNGTTIRVGRQKKGLRSIAVGKQKPITCSLITTETLPDYPTKDMRTGFADNGYRDGDSVTIIGWLKDMPQEEWHTLRFPVINTSEVWLDEHRTEIMSVVEPGETYFFQYDYKTGQKLFPIFHEQLS